jgi:N-acetylmuramoyl-L-alanine amidase
MKASSLVTAALAAIASTFAPQCAPAETTAPSNLELGIIGPREERSTTTREFLNVLGRTAKDAKVRVGGEDATVLPTGLFVRDRVPLAMGANTIPVEATAPDGATATRMIEVTRVFPAPPETISTATLVIVPSSIRPDTGLMVAPGDPVEVSFRGSPGMIAEASVLGKPWQKLGEEADPATGQHSGVYRGVFVASSRDDMESQPVRLRLRAAPKAKVRGARVVQARSEARIGVWSPDKVRLFVVREDGTEVAYGIHEVRLGGPYLAELTSGTVLRVTGQKGASYRVRLAPDTDGWVSARAVDPAPPGTPLPYLVFTNISIFGEESGDAVVIPYGAPVPYAVHSEEDAEGRDFIIADFYGAHDAATWNSHKATAKLVREARVEQPATGRIRVRIDLNGDRLWGYKVDQTTGSVRISVRRAPAMGAAPDSPLKGMRVALEPGHGGPRNLGAMGYTGVPEKEINRMTVEALKAELEKAGAEIVVVRPGDENPGLAERARRATEANADILISMHANSGGTQNGYLRVGGASTYYKHAFCRGLSAAIHRRLLEKTGLDDFGNVGAFNYTPIRVTTWMPSMLVEQAFMSNPADEAKMLDPAFRAKTAEAVRLGIEDYLAAK